MKVFWGHGDEHEKPLYTEECCFSMTIILILCPVSHNLVTTGVL